MKTLLLLLALTLTGCLSVPKTTITGAIDGQPFSLTSPKDCDLEGLEITAQSGGLTNYARISIQKVHTRMNPEVITTTGAAQALLLKTTFDGATQLAEKVAAAKP